MAFSIAGKFYPIKEYRVVGYPGFWVVEAKTLYPIKWSVVNKFGYIDEEYYWYDTVEDARSAKGRFEQFGEDEGEKNIPTTSEHGDYKGY